jgi:quinol monooxygenase YgiN
MRPCFLTTVVAASMSLASICAQAQQEDPSLFATSYIEVVPASEAATENVLRQLAEATRKEEGVLTFEIAQLILPTNQFVIFGAWKDQQAYRDHLAAAHAKQANAALGPQSIAPIDTHLARQIVQQALQRPPEGAIYGVSHIAVLPEKIDDIHASLIKYAAATRQAAGNLRYHAVQDASRRNHFSIVEIWKDQASENAHEAAAPSKDFRAALGPIQGPLYDRRWYKTF